MSQEIYQAHVQAYKNALIAKYQQTESKLRECVSFDADIRGKVFYVDLLGPTEMVKKTTRHGDTPLVDSPHSRRQGPLETFEWADLIDAADVVRMLTNPTSAYVMNAAAAAGRQADRTIITAFNADVKEGENGENTVVFPAGQKIVHGSAGLTLDKIVEAAEKLSAANVPMEGRYFAVSPRALSYTLSDTTISSADYNTVKTLMSGTMTEFMGFTWKISTLLPKTGNIRSCFAWHAEAMVLAEPASLLVDVGPRRDKSLSTQVFVEGHWGALRRQDAGVVAVEIDESVVL